MWVSWPNFLKDRVLFFQNPAFFEIAAGYAVDFRMLWMCIKMQGIKWRPSEDDSGPEVA